VISTLLIAVAIQGWVLELARKPTFRQQYRTVLLAIVLFGGDSGALMSIARNKTKPIDHIVGHGASVAPRCSKASPTTASWSRRRAT
jgi:hypothetical protein